jgi:enoyl-CoA hydratase
LSTRLRSSHEQSILLLTLESADGFPRIERRLLAELSREMKHLAGSSHLYGAVITGGERAFAVGAEIAELAALTPPEAFDFSREGQQAMRAIERSSKPVIAAIRGYCMGGGLDLALACHARIVALDSVFSHPGGAIGILTGWGGTQRLPRLIGRSPALELLMTGRRIEAPEARDIGLVTEIVPGDKLIAQAIRHALGQFPN